MRAYIFHAALAATLLAGCVNLAPDYQRPAAPIPATFPYGSGGPDSVLATDMDWRDFITDTRLRRVMELTLINNRDLRIAALNIERARAQYRIERADLLPTIEATATGSRQRSLGVNGQRSNSSLYTVELGFSSYEIDFFSRIRNLSDAALEIFFAVEKNQRSAQISLVAEVTTVWLTLAADTEKLKLAQETLQSQRKSYELVRRVQELGGASGLTVAQAQTTVDTARVDVAGFTSRVALDRNALELLVGTTLPDDLLPSTGLTTASLLVDVPANLPSTILLRRPDVLAAEHVLRASNANIGAARAAFFPSISLTTAAGIASRSLDGLFSGGSGVWSFVPQITLPIFDSGRIQSNLDVAKVQLDIDIANYEKTLQIAFREAADALTQRSTLSEQLAAQQSLVEATTRSFTLSTALFKNGVNNYLQVLDAQRSLYAAQQAEITLRLSEHTNRITLYKVLGGGWAS